MKKKHPKSDIHGMSEWANPKNKPSMHTDSTQKQYPDKKKIEAAGNELKHNPPAVLSSTRKKFGSKAAKRQRVAIMLNKARKA